MRLSNVRIATQLLLMFAITLLISGAITALGASLGSQLILASAFEHAAAAQATALAEAVSVSLGNQNNDVVVQILAAPLATSGTVDAVAVYDQRLRMVTMAQAKGSPLAPIQPTDEATALGTTLATGQPHSAIKQDHIDAVAPVRLSNKLVGVVYIRLSLSEPRRLAALELPKIIIGSLWPQLFGILVAIWAAYALGRPLRGLAARAEAVGQGDLSDPPTSTRRDEIGQLTRAFGQMVDNLRAARAEVIAQQDALESRVTARTAELEQALAELKTTLTEREQLSATVRELGIPVVPVLRGVLVMPLVGTIDATRANGLLEALLRGVERHRARTVILDATGVPLIDTQVARVLLQAADAAGLLGAQVTLVGLQPEVAQTIVGLGLDLSRMKTRADLQTAVAEALRGQPTEQR